MKLKKIIIFVLFFTHALYMHPEETVEKIFTNIFNQNVWGDKESLSGTGSNMLQTKTIRTEIPKLLKKCHVKIFMDAPCGDFYWMQQVKLSPHTTYIGIDIVQKLIDTLSKKFSDKKRVFLCKNIITDTLPYADLVLCRDCFSHLEYRHIAQILKNFKKSGIKYLLTTTYPTKTKNTDIKLGEWEWRPLNLTIPPFNFPPPVQMIVENCTESPEHKDKSLALWKLENLPDINLD